MGEIVGWVARSAWRIIVTVVGFALLLGGVVMIVTPGPGILLIVAGFAVLGTQYAWARRALRMAQGQVKKLRNRARRRPR